jgi:hypothetical protein
MKNIKYRKSKRDTEHHHNPMPLLDGNNSIDDRSPATGNYIPDDSDAQIFEFDTMLEIDDLFSDYIFGADDLNFELQYELGKQIEQIRSAPVCSDNDNYQKIHLLELRQNILEYIRDVLSSKELFILDRCVSTYASVCSCPYERLKEIRINIYHLQDWFKSIQINSEEFENKICQIDPLILHELTEIMINSEIIYHCVLDPENSNNYPALESAF